MNYFILFRNNYIIRTNLINKFRGGAYMERKGNGKEPCRTVFGN